MAFPYHIDDVKIEKSDSFRCKFNQ